MQTTYIHNLIESPRLYEQPKHWKQKMQSNLH
jgi:hypothetical protein